MEGGAGGRGARAVAKVGDVRDGELDDAIDLEIEKVHGSHCARNSFNGLLGRVPVGHHLGPVDPIRVRAELTDPAAMTPEIRLQEAGLLRVPCRAVKLRDGARFIAQFQRQRILHGMRIEPVKRYLAHEETPIPLGPP
jgi:hypothetical protein